MIEIALALIYSIEPFTWKSYDSFSNTLVHVLVIQMYLNYINALLTIVAIAGRCNDELLKDGVHTISHVYSMGGLYNANLVLCYVVLCHVMLSYVVILSYLDIYLFLLLDQLGALK